MCETVTTPSFRQFLEWQYKDRNRTDAVSSEDYKRFSQGEDQSKEDFFKMVWEQVKKYPFDFALTKKSNSSKYSGLSGDKLMSRMKNDLQALRRAEL
jgi:hypothetical protein